MLQRMPVLSLTTIIHVWGQLVLSLFFTGLLPCSLSSVHHFVILTTSFPFSSCQFLFLLVLFSSPCLLHSCVPLISFSHSLLLVPWVALSGFVMAPVIQVDVMRDGSREVLFPEAQSPSDPNFFLLSDRILYCLSKPATLVFHFCIQV